MYKSGFRFIIVFFADIDESEGDLGNLSSKGGEEAPGVHDDDLNQRLTHPNFKMKRHSTILLAVYFAIKMSSGNYFHILFG